MAASGRWRQEAGPQAARRRCPFVNKRHTGCLTVLIDGFGFPGRYGEHSLRMPSPQRSTGRRAAATDRAGQSHLELSRLRRLRAPAESTTENERLTRAPTIDRGALQLADDRPGLLHFR